MNANESPELAQVLDDVEDFLDYEIEINKTTGVWSVDPTRLVSELRRIRAKP